MKVKKTLLIASVLMCSQAFAQSNVEHTKVANVINQYAKLISCNYDIKQKNIINMTTNESYQPIYYVLWQGDVGCAGGSGTTAMEITAVEKNKNMNFGYSVSTYPVLAEDIYFELNPRFIESISKVSNNQIQITTWQARNDDELNYPSMKVKYTLKRTEENAPWKIINKLFIQTK